MSWPVAVMPEGKVLTFDSLPLSLSCSELYDDPADAGSRNGCTKKKSSQIFQIRVTEDCKATWQQGLRTPPSNLNITMKPHSYLATEERVGSLTLSRDPPGWAEASALISFLIIQHSPLYLLFIKTPVFFGCPGGEILAASSDLA